VARKKDSQEENRIYEVEEPNEVEQALRELPNEEDTISLFRMHDQGRPKFIDKLYPQEFDLKMIKAKYGGGRYKVTALVEDQEITKVFEVEGQMIESGLNPAPRSEDGKGHWVSHEEAEVIKPYPRTFSEVVDRMKSIEDKLDARQPKDSNGGMDLIKVLLPFMMGNREDPKKSIIDELTLLKSLIGPTNPVNIETGIIMEAIKMGREISDTGGAEGSGGSRLIEVVEKILNHPVTLGIIQTVKNSQAGQSLARPPDQINNPPVLTGFKTVAPLLQPYIPSFIASASASSDPNILVDMALPLIPKDKYPQVIEWLKTPTWFNDLMGLDPRIEVQSAWWKGFADILLQALSEPETPEPEIVVENPDQV